MRFMTALTMFGALMVGAASETLPAGDAPDTGAPESEAEDTMPVERHIPQTLCPVMGGAINKEIHADHDGKRVYFCCPPCAAKFLEDPAGYVEKLESEGISLERVPQPQTTCPITGDGISEHFFLDHGGWRIYACSAVCVETLAVEPAVYIERLHQQGVTLKALVDKETEDSSGSAVPEDKSHSQHEHGESTHH
jgi:YHS domain-containing protein